MRIRFTGQALSDLNHVAHYLKKRNPNVARRVRSAILATIAILKDYPAAGREQTTPGVRKIVARKYHYLIYYRADREDVSILSVQHPAQERTFEDD